MAESFPNGPLAGIRILDLSRVLAGPYATMVLNDLGAEVIKVEQPGRGDIARGNGPFIDGQSSYFMSINRGKRSITLDLSRPEGKDILLELVRKSDVLVENFVPGTMKRLGLDYEAVREHNPGLVYASCSGFGQTGPYAGKPAFDVVVQAMGGIMSVTGEPGGPPVRPGASIGDIMAGMFLCIGVLSALQERSRSGLGQMIDISMLDCQVALQENAFARYFATGEVPGPLGTRHPVFSPFQVFVTRDSHVAVAIAGDQWPLFCAVIDRVDIIDDPRFADGYLRTQNYAELEPILNAAFRSRDTFEWIRGFEEAGISCGPVNRIDQVAVDSQVVARNMFTEVVGPENRKYRVVNSPVQLSRTPASVVRTSPDLGQDTEGVLRDIAGMSPSQIESVRERGVI